MSEPIEDRVTVETWHVVCIRQENGTETRKLGGMFDMWPGKRGLTLPVVDLNKRGLSKKEAEALAERVREYFRDVKEKPDSKRAGSSKFWK